MESRTELTKNIVVLLFHKFGSCASSFTILNFKQVDTAIERRHIQFCFLIGKRLL